MLTKCIFDVLSYNGNVQINGTRIVVICLQNVSLMCWVTTLKRFLQAFVQLWFAYKMYLWCVELQPISNVDLSEGCCDLLTKCIFDVLSYNYWFACSSWITVVICLQNVSLMCWVTTVEEDLCVKDLLWFAYKMYLWCVELQRVISF